MHDGLASLSSRLQPRLAPLRNPNATGCVQRKVGVRWNGANRHRSQAQIPVISPTGSHSVKVINCMARRPVWGTSFRKSFRRQWWFASFRPCPAANAPSEVGRPGSAESAKPFKCLFLKVLPRHRERIVTGTRRAFNVRCDRAAESSVKQILRSAFLTSTVRFG